ncbi:CPK1, partial [Symbiodinium pilosum]
FWVQRRSADVKKARRGMNWHFDKDEDLLDDVGLCVHPCVATATYLTDRGAPLVVLSAPKLPRGQDGAPDADAQPASPPHNAAAYVAFPARGLHVAFGGDLLHGVPAELECKGGERLALLVNVWLHHRPAGLQSCGKVCSRAWRGSTKPGSALRVGLFRRRFREDGAVAIEPGLADWQINGVQIPRDLQQGVWRVQQRHLKVVPRKRKNCK